MNTLLGLVFFSFLQLGLALTKTDCPKDLQSGQNVQVFGDSCFQFVFDKRRDYRTAERECEHYKGTLAVVKSREISDFLYDQIVNVYKMPGGFLIGLNKIRRGQQEEFYKWEDGARLDQGTFQNWAAKNGPHRKPGYFKKANDCVVMDTSLRGKWRDVMCPEEAHLSYRIYLRYICQYRVEHTPASTIMTTAALKPTTTTTTTTSTKPTTTTTTTAAPRSTTTTTTTTTPKPTCPPFVCTKDCGMDGYLMNDNGCSICDCDV